MYILLRAYLVRLLMIFLIATLAACGGGGSTSGSDSSGNNLQSQNALKVTPSNVEVVMFESLTLAVSGGSGGGSLRYSSSDTSIITVSDAGELSPVAVGVAQVTIEKAAQGNYRAASTVVDVTVIAAEQPALVFEHGYLDSVVGAEVPANSLSGGAGEGAITFAASDSTVASVDSSGKVSVYNAGTVEIRAVKAADNYYQQAEASYQLDIGIVVDQLAVSVGREDTAITWQAQEGVMQVKRYTTSGCGFAAAHSCANTKVWSADSTESLPLIDTFTKFDQVALVELQNEVYSSNALEVSPKRLPFFAYQQVALAEFKGKHWAFGGYDGDDFSSEIWSSVDGVNWLLETDNADFGSLAETKVLEFDGNLYLFSGVRPYFDDNGDYFGRLQIGDVWRSNDGVNWSEINDGNAPVHMGHVAVHDGRLWAVKMEHWYGTAPEVWSSEDGISWSLEGQDLPFGKRSGAMFYSDGEKMYVAGGHTGSSQNRLNDSWVSTNGLEWEHVGSSSEIASHWDGHVEYFNDAFYMFPGWPSDYEKNSPIYKSSDGVAWSAIATLPFKAGLVSVLATDSDLNVINFDDRYLWQSENGVDWRTPVPLGNITWQRR